MKCLTDPDVLRETRARLLSVTADARPLWGRMTATQMMGHLACSYEVGLGTRSVAPMKGPPQWLLKWAALRSGLLWPRNLKTTPELERAIEQESRTDFQAGAAAAIEGLEALAMEPQLAASHPMFGAMSKANWMRWGYLHADHHLRQFGR